MHVSKVTENRTVMANNKISYTIHLMTSSFYDAIFSNLNIHHVNSHASWHIYFENKNIIKEMILYDRRKILNKKKHVILQIMVV